ncbi:MAG: VC_2705 family sodium/solute symporter, partial [Burkholderiaceae bacterium]
TGVAFELGVFLGLGGILVCSFLGGMRAVTWTQVAQYIVLIVAFLIPVMWLSIKQPSSPVPQLSYGYQLAQVGQLEQTLISDPKELEVQAIFAQRAKDLEAKLHNPASALRADRKAAQTLVASLKAAQAPLNERAAAERVLATMPRTLDGATSQWRAQLEVANTKMKPLNGMTPHAQPFAGDPDGSEQERDSFETSRRNFIALVFCLVFGTAALPHVLVRYYTTPSVRAARQSVTWSLFFILLLYLTAPALAVMVKYEIFNGLVGSSFDNLPAWVSAWSKVDPSLLSLTDINKDGLVQLNELSIGSDIIVLATPEIAGLPYVVSGLIAAGGLAAALSTADGLLLTVANALSHDLYYKLIDPKAST